VASAIPVLCLVAPQLHPERCGLVAEPIGGDQRLVGIGGGELLRRLQPDTEARRQRLRPFHIAGGEQQPGQFAVGVGIVRVRFQGGLEMIARLHGQAARDIDATGQEV